MILKDTSDVFGHITRILKAKKMMVGVARFELATPSPPDSPRTYQQGMACDHICRLAGYLYWARHEQSWENTHPRNFL